MAQADELEEQLVKHIDEAHAMENNVLRMLDGMIETTDDPEIRTRSSGTGPRPRRTRRGCASGSRRTASRRRWCARPAASSAR